MSTVLEIFQDTVRECGITTEKPSTVLNQTGELAQVLAWIRDAYKDIQTRHDGHWRWLRREFTLTTVADDGTYAYSDCTDVLAAEAIDRFRSWDLNDRLDPPKIYLQSAGKGTEGWLTFARFDNFQSIYGRGNQNSSYPHFISVDDADNLRLGDKPNGIYVITGHYRRSAQIFTFDEAADDNVVPEMPSDFHDLIMYGAMRKYGYFNSAQEMIDRAVDESTPLMRSLKRNQLPKMRGARALA